jgi:hypothetical protein
MRVELPSKQADGSPNWVDLRDKLRPSDGWIADDAAKITSKGDGETVFSPATMENDRRNALLGRLITAWSFPVPIPSQNSFQAADVVIDGAMDFEDYAVLAEAVQPVVDKISGKGRPNPKTPSEN